MGRYFERRRKAVRNESGNLSDVGAEVQEGYHMLRPMAGLCIGQQCRGGSAQSF